MKWNTARAIPHLRLNKPRLNKPRLNKARRYSSAYDPTSVAARQAINLLITGIIALNGIMQGLIVRAQGRLET